MASAILGTLPLAIGIALNPIAIVAGILILRTAHHRRNGLVFAAGWVFGLILLGALSTRIVLLQTRGGRGALSTMARTAVIAGTATAVSNKVAHAGAAKAASQQAAQQAETAQGDMQQMQAQLALLGIARLLLYRVQKLGVLPDGSIWELTPLWG